MYHACLAHYKVLLAWTYQKDALLALVTRFIITKPNTVRQFTVLPSNSDVKSWFEWRSRYIPDKERDNLYFSESLLQIFRRAEGRIHSKLWSLCTEQRTAAQPTGISKYRQLWTHEGNSSHNDNSDRGKINEVWAVIKVGDKATRRPWVGKPF